MAPVLPALTMAEALPSRTSSAARTSEESFLRRTPCAGSSSMAMTSVQATSSRPPGVADLVGRADQHDRDPVLVRPRSAPATISPGALSPPIASTATGRVASVADRGAGPCGVNSVDLDRLATLVPAAVRADHVGHLGLGQWGQTLRAGRRSTQLAA